MKIDVTLYDYTSRKEPQISTSEHSFDPCPVDVASTLAIASHTHLLLKPDLKINYFAIIRQGDRKPSAFGFCDGQKCDCLQDFKLNDGDRIWFFGERAPSKTEAEATCKDEIKCNRCGNTNPYIVAPDGYCCGGRGCDVPDWMPR